MPTAVARAAFGCAAQCTNLSACSRPQKYRDSLSGAEVDRRPQSANSTTTTTTGPLTLETLQGPPQSPQLPVDWMEATTPPGTPPGDPTWLDDEPADSLWRGELVFADAVLVDAPSFAHPAPPVRFHEPPRHGGSEVAHVQAAFRQLLQWQQPEAHGAGSASQQDFGTFPATSAHGGPPPQSFSADLFASSPPSVQTDRDARVITGRMPAAEVVVSAVPPTRSFSADLFSAGSHSISLARMRTHSHC